MSRAHTITTTTIDRWLLPHIASVLAYAQQDTAFAIMLAMWLDEENWAITPVPDVAPSRYLTPHNIDTAEDITDWLMHELVTHPEARIARSLLVSWASDFDMPLDATAGVDGLALGGLSMGLSKKARTNARLQIVVDEAWQSSQSPMQLSQRTHALTQRVIATELRKAGGKVGSLHPNTAEWCMAAAGTALYTAPQGDLKTLHDAALADDLHHIAQQDEAGVTMLAISPTVRDSFVEELVA